MLTINGNDQTNQNIIHIYIISRQLCDGHKSRAFVNPQILLFHRYIDIAVCQYFIEMMTIGRCCTFVSAVPDKMPSALSNFDAWLLVAVTFFQHTYCLLSQFTRGQSKNWPIVVLQWCWQHWHYAETIYWLIDWHVSFYEMHWFVCVNLHENSVHWLNTVGHASLWEHNVRSLNDWHGTAATHTRRHNQPHNSLPRYCLWHKFCQFILDKLVFNRVYDIFFLFICFCLFLILIFASCHTDHYLIFIGIFYTSVSKL